MIFEKTRNIFLFYGPYSIYSTIVVGVQVEARSCEVRLCSWFLVSVDSFLEVAGKAPPLFWAVAVSESGTRLGLLSIHI